MPNAHVAAAATGLPELNRRRMLLGLAAASTAAASPVIAAVSRQTEKAALLALGDETAGILQACRDASAERAAIVKSWGPSWPKAPAEITVWNRATLFDYERDLAGRIVTVAHRVQSSEHLQDRVAYWQENHREPLSGRFTPKGAAKRRAHQLKRLNECEAQFAVAAKYEADCKRVREASGYASADGRLRAAQEQLLDHTSLVMAEEPESMAGIFIQAEALKAVANVELLLQAARQHMDANNWGQAIATSLLRLSAGGAVRS